MSEQVIQSPGVARRKRIAATLAQEAQLPHFMLATPEGLFLHESVQNGALTANRAHAWRGTREKMHRALDIVPENIRNHLRPRRIAAPQPAERLP